jgi:anaphase-promoting complex subunit 2
LLPITIAHLVYALTTWYEAWRPPPELPLFCSSFRTAFQTHLYTTLPPSFNVGFQRLVRFTLDKAPSWAGDVQLPSSLLDFSIWKQFEALGMLERYENIVHSVVYGYMEDHVERECRGTWTEKLLEMNEWLSTELFPWLFHPFAQQARSRLSFACSGQHPRLTCVPQTMKHARWSRRSASSSRVRWWRC